MSSLLLPTCPECHSDNIIADADMHWNANGQYWKVVEPFSPDSFDCQDCDHQFSEPAWTDNSE